MIQFTLKDRVLTFAVRVIPRASKSEIVGAHDGALKVRIASPPVDGGANKELIRLLAKELGVAKNAVEIVSGHSSKLKQVHVTGVRADLVRRLFGP